MTTYCVYNIIINNQWHIQPCININFSMRRSAVVHKEVSSPPYSVNLIFLLKMASVIP